MWIISFALFTVCGVVSDAPDICAKGPHICFTRPVEPLEFPDSIEAVDKICPIITARLRCQVDYKKQCGLGIMESIDDNLKIYEFFSDMCDKDSELHQELSIRLPCLEGVIMSHRNACQPIVEDAMEAVRGRILGTGYRDTIEGPAGWRRYFCLSEALDFACLSASTSVTCGNAAKHLVGAVVDHVGYMDIICTADIRKKVKEMVSVMQLEMEERLAIRNIVSKV